MHPFRSFFLEPPITSVKERLHSGLPGVVLRESLIEMRGNKKLFIGKLI